VKIRNKDTAYTIKADPKDKNLKNVLLLTQEGKTISYLKKTFLAFEYKLLKADILELAELTADEDITLTFKKFDSGKDKQLLVVEDIIYAKDQYKVNAQAEEILNEVFDLLNKNVNVKLEIVSHTDAQGDDDANRKLSEKRAEAVAEYLIAKGISKSRITSKGKGETQIRNRCTNGINCSDKEHSYNRRTEFVFSK
jgi:outer membrane protein OmpA-like peptidoglycan-associated protein